MRHTRSIAFALVVAACSHSEPFPPPETGTEVPFNPGPPARLTAQSGDDGALSVTPDGSNLLYVVDHRCIAFLPVEEARDTRWLCPTPEQFIVDGFDHAVLSPIQQFALVRTRRMENSSLPFYKALLVAPLSDIRDTVEVIPIPFRPAVDGILRQDITQLAWLHGDTLAMLADGAIYLTDPADTTRPREFVPVVLPGRVAVMQASRDGESLYFKLFGDGRIQVWKASTRSIATLANLGPSTVNALAVGDTHLAVTTGAGLIRFHLGDGARDTFPVFGLAVTEVAMTPDGKNIVVSAMDTTRSGNTDLYRILP
jgi:WD40-like Beta Propeller Repeat